MIFGCIAQARNYIGSPTRNRLRELGCALTKETFKSPPSGTVVVSAAFLPIPPAVASTFFLFTLGSSALSAACLFTPTPVGGPKYAASSFTLLRAWGRDREPANTVLVIVAAAEALDWGDAVQKSSVNNNNSVAKNTDVIN